MTANRCRSDRCTFQLGTRNMQTHQSRPKRAARSEKTEKGEGVNVRDSCIDATTPLYQQPIYGVSVPHVWSVSTHYMRCQHPLYPMYGVCQHPT